MYDTEILLGKINTSRAIDDENIQLSSLMACSFAEIWASYKDILSWGEATYLSDQAQQQRRKNKEEEARILSRANPQLQRAVRLGIDQAVNQRDYDTQFGDRAQQYVRPGSVASMFSPAGYLTELYREARDLHALDSSQHLDVRRPDIARLALSQQNMDNEVSTLSVSNNILLTTFASRGDISTDMVLENLSTWRLSGATPYHLPYEAARQAVLLQDPTLEVLADNPDIASQVDLYSLLGIFSDISPELYAILTETITAENASQLYADNYEILDSSKLLNTWQLAEYFDIDEHDLFTLTSLLAHRDFSLPIRYYHNNVLTTFVTSDDGASGEVIQIVGSGILTLLNYLELLPQGGNSYLVNFSVKKTQSDSDVLAIGTGTARGADDIYDGYMTPLANQAISIPATLSADSLIKGITIGISRMGNGTVKNYSSFTFKQTTLSTEQYLLYLNKIIRLYKACHYTPDQMCLLIYNLPGTEMFDTRVLILSFLSQYYMQRYPLSLEEAMILSGGYISTVSIDGQKSYFDTLFNSPPLNNREFQADNLSANWEAQDADNLFRTAVILRGCQITGAELKTLWLLAAGSNVAFTTSGDNLALLYRTHQLADLHDISAAELSMLLSVSPWGGKALASLDAQEFARVVEFVYSTTRWLSDQGWTVSALYLMLTPNYSTQLTPEMESLLNALHNALSGMVFPVSTASLITALAPVIAATEALELSGKAESVLAWLDQLKPGGIDVQIFAAQLLKGNHGEAEMLQLVSFCQVLGQLALMVRITGVSDYLLAALVARPALLQSGLSVIPQRIDILRLLNRTSARILQTGDYARQLLASLEAGSLSTTLLAQALTESSLMVQQARTLAEGSSGELITSLSTLDLTLQWMNVASGLKTTPSAVAALIALKYINITAGNPPSYADWVAASTQLQAGLSPQQTSQLQQRLDEQTSAALSVYFIQSSGIPGVSSREMLYAWLLIDGQVSSQVMTTPIGEAIAGIQLYVNRCLNSLESGVQRNVLTRQFFTDWERYNKRYSTWAGVSRLVYYPENYLDPTVRLGQTGMMNEMLQNIGQSELSGDTVGDAFKAYMTRFEKIANLEIVSSYHDNVSIEEGRTWFIGKSTTEGEKYYWRSLRQNMLSNGKYPATAWSEWVEIGTAIAAWNKMVRPVIFNDRLYVVWVTEKVIGIASDNVTEVLDYFLSVSYIRHDGTWSTPLNAKLSDYGVATDINALSAKNLFCTNSNNAAAEIVIIFYTAMATEAENKSQTVAGISLSAEHEFSRVANANYYSGFVWQQYDLQNEQRVNFPLVEGTLSFSAGGLSYSWGFEGLALLSGGSYSVDSFVVNTTTKSADITLNADVRYQFSGTDSGSFGNSRGELINLIKLRPVGNTYIFYADPVRVLSGTSQSSEYVFAYVTKNSPGYGPHGLIKAQKTVSNKSIWFPYSAKPNQGYMLLDIKSGSNTSDTFIFQPGWTVASQLGSTYTIKSNDELGSQSGYNPVTFTSQVDPKGISVQLSNSSITKTFNGADNISADKRPTPGWDTTYRFTGLTISIPLTNFTAGKADINIRFLGSTALNHSLGEQNATLTFYQTTDTRKMSIFQTASGAKYLQRSIYRTRINTLFARQLVARANLGLEAVLSMETQQLQEPQLGKGFYVDFVMPAYDASVHGSRTYYLYTMYIRDKTSKDPIYAGMFADSPTTVRIFVPLADSQVNSDVLVQVFLVTDKVNVASGNAGWKGPHFIYVDDDETIIGIHSSSVLTMFQSINILTVQNEPMDFSGANALYFWEMFFYVPSMVFQRLLQESKFDEATAWIKYIWNPAGYYNSNRGNIVRDIAYYRYPSSPTVTEERITRHQYSAPGFLAQSSDPRLYDAGVVNVSYLADLNGTVLYTQSIDAGITIALEDAAGRPFLNISGIASAADRRGSTTQTWQYEGSTLPGRLLSITEQLPGENARITERFVWGGNTLNEQGYNQAGQCISHYDTAGLLLTDSFSLNGSPLAVTRRLLKAADDPDTVVDWQGIDASAWNDLLEVTTYTTLSSRDAADNELTTTDAAGNVQRVAYDVAGLLKGSWLTLKKGSEQAIVASLSWSAAGQKLREEHGNGVVTTYGYEAETQRLTSIKTERPSGHPAGAKVLQALRYEYDPVGNVLAITDDAEAVVYWNNQKVVAENKYSYDSLYQMVSAIGREMANAAQQSSDLPQFVMSDSANYTNYTRLYSYDGGGNLTKIQHSAPALGNNYTTTITVSNRSNRAVLSTLTEDPAKVDALFTAGGLQTTLLAGQNLSWTPRSELQKVIPVVRTGSQDDVESYRYDADSQRILKNTSQLTSGSRRVQLVVYLPGLELRTTATGGTIAETLHVLTVGVAGRAQVRVLHWESGKPAAIASDSVRYSYDNLIGSSNLELDGTGEIITKEEYYPYGGSSVLTGRNQTEADYKTVRYSAKERDASGLYYYGYRYYQPWTARWLSADPSGTMDGLNLFRMVRNNPAVLADTDGLAPHTRFSHKNTAFNQHVENQGLSMREFWSMNLIAKSYNWDINIRTGNSARVQYVGEFGHRPKPAGVYQKTNKVGEMQGLVLYPNAQLAKGHSDMHHISSPSASAPDELKKLSTEGFHLQERMINGELGGLIVDSHGNDVYGDIDIHSVLDKVGMRVDPDVWVKTINDFFDTQGLHSAANLQGESSVMKPFGVMAHSVIQHGAHDDWTERNNDKYAGGINMGPQPGVINLTGDPSRSNKLFTTTDEYRTYLRENAGTGDSVYTEKSWAAGDMRSWRSGLRSSWANKPSRSAAVRARGMLKNLSRRGLI